MSWFIFYFVDLSFNFFYVENVRVFKHVILPTTDQEMCANLLLNEQKKKEHRKLRNKLFF